MVEVSEATGVIPGEPCEITAGGADGPDDAVIAGEPRIDADGRSQAHHRVRRIDRDFTGVVESHGPVRVVDLADDIGIQRAIDVAGRATGDRIVVEVDHRIARSRAHDVPGAERPAPAFRRGESQGGEDLGHHLRLDVDQTESPGGGIDAVGLEGKLVKRVAEGRHVGQTIEDGKRRIDSLGSLGSEEFEERSINAVGDDRSAEAVLIAAEAWSTILIPTIGHVVTQVGGLPAGERAEQ